MPTHKHNFHSGLNHKQYFLEMAKGQYWTLSQPIEVQFLWDIFICETERDILALSVTCLFSLVTEQMTFWPAGSRTWIEIITFYYHLSDLGAHICIWRWSLQLCSISQFISSSEEKSDCSASQCVFSNSYMPFIASLSMIFQRWGRIL